MALLTPAMRANCAAALLALLGTGSSLAGDRVAPEYEVKAAFLYNFAVLTEWPTNAFADAKSPLVIGVLGEDPFGKALAETLSRKLVNDRPLRFEQYRTVEEIKDCHILFISASEADALSEILKRLAGRSILTVGDVDRFARQGGMIQMVKQTDNTIGLRINPDAAAAARLKLSSKLLRLGTIVRTSPPPGER